MEVLLSAKGEIQHLGRQTCSKQLLNQRGPHICGRAIETSRQTRTTSKAMPCTVSASRLVCNRSLFLFYSGSSDRARYGAPGPHFISVIMPGNPLALASIQRNLISLPPYRTRLRRTGPPYVERVHHVESRTRLRRPQPRTGVWLFFSLLVTLLSFSY